MNFFSFFVLSLATYRISSLFVQEDGPFFVFRKIRELTGIKHDESGDLFQIPETFFGGMLSCVWCCSVWVAFFLWGSWLLAGDIVVTISIWPAMSAGAIIVNSFINRD